MLKKKDITILKLQQGNDPTLDHPLENIIGELDRPVSTRLQLHEQALFCYYDAFLTAVKPKMLIKMLYSITAGSKAMQEVAQMSSKTP
ncbi:hypothetical protein Tco_1346780 [Tanacetum coccineum]